MLRVHRYLYYVLQEPIVDDFKYDVWESELKKLLAEFPEMEDAACPTKTVGSTLAGDYELEIAELAARLLAYHKEQNAPKKFGKLF
jgi:NAD-dependent DNA ligase